MQVYAYRNHAGNYVTLCSRSVLVVFLNNVSIYWSLKNQTSYENSMSVSDLVEMNQACKYVSGIWYKLIIMGIPVEDPTYVCGDNQSVLANTTMPKSTIKKKSNVIVFHFVREWSARDECRMAHINTHIIFSDMMINPLTPGEKHMRFATMILHHL